MNTCALSVIVAGFFLSNTHSLAGNPNPIRDTTALPAFLWVTAGTLSNQGMVFQLQLERLSRPSTRDAKSGLWLPYAPAKAAISFLKSNHSPKAK